MSGYVSGVLSNPQRLFRKDTARSMIAHFLRDSGFNEKTRVWNYSWGDILEGWTAADNVSTNTPDWKGDKSNTTGAHVSYRSMDAAAVLQANAQLKLGLSDSILIHIRDLMAEGWLLPLISSHLVDNGLEPVLQPQIALWQGRAAFAYDAPSQVWAIFSLVRSPAVPR
jgi:hypothetical protein